MRNVKLGIAFDGTAYAGWQRQADQATVQGVLEETIARMTQAEVTLHGAGRTDAGVHALGMVANFHTSSTISCQALKKGLNSLLPQDIRIVSVVDAPADFHARFHAKGKTYVYHVDCRPVHLPHCRLYSAHLPQEIDLSNMKKSLAMLVGEHDFSSFEASGSRDLAFSKRGAVRRIFEASMEVSPDKQSFSVVMRGDGFLRHMVRNIVGTIFEVGIGKIDPEQFRTIIASKNRAAASATAPAKGLFLKEVFY